MEEQVKQTMWSALAEYTNWSATSFDDLPPILADRYRAAAAVVQAHFGEVEDYTRLAPSVKPFVEAFWIARDKSGAKATENKHYPSLPESFVIGDYPVRWESVGGATVYPLVSTTSLSVAVVVCVPTTIDPDTGWPLLYPSRRDAGDGAEFFVLDIYPDMDWANGAILQLQKAFRTLDAVGRENARIADRHSLRDKDGDGASF